VSERTVLYHQSYEYTSLFEWILSSNSGTLKTNIIGIGLILSQMSNILSQSFVDSYKDATPPFGFNGLGEFTYRRTYARPVDEKTNEEWYQTIARVVNGVYEMQKEHIDKHGLGWDERKPEAEEMYDRMFHMKFLPPGRGLWAMGTDLTRKRGLYAALNNCAFVSTKDMGDNPTRPFTFLMDASMLGVGVGFDTEGAGTIRIIGEEDRIRNPLIHYVEDSREGWVHALELLLDHYFYDGPVVYFHYDKIRPAGAPIKGFGGTASGPEPLIQLLINVATVLNKRRGQLITITDITDIMNYIGVCVIAGNVRRTAEIAFGSAYSKEFMNLKNYEINPHRMDYGWTSNNSVFADVGMDYNDIVDNIKTNGEPGLAWLKNMQNFSRMGSKRDFKDGRVQGGNPCLEQSLESFELCCLVETFPNHHDNLVDFERTLKFAYLYAKTVTLGNTHWPETNRVMLRNRRIGCSMSGIAQFIAQYGIPELRRWCRRGYNTLEHYDKLYSDWLAIPRSIKMTSIKPSGTVSLLAGATPGMHYPESRFYIRRVRVSKNSPLLQGIHPNDIEPSVTDPNTMVVSFYIDVGGGVRTIEDVGMWEQLELAAFLQEHWADNQVSATVTFTPEEGNQINKALDFYQYRLKGVSFLPKCQPGTYAQMPYEKITESMYRLRQFAEKIIPNKGRNAVLDPLDVQREMYCDGDACTLPLVPPKLRRQSATYDLSKFICSCHSNVPCLHHPTL
jgi:ribonucleoside-triphosphate reductase (thioredoxin)